MEYRARYLNGGLRLLTNAPVPLDEGEVVLVSIERGRSAKSHNHQFAWLHDAWANLPERLAGLPWAETPETLRKHALIATGYHQMTVIDVGTNAAAARVKAAALELARKAHGYAVAQVRGPILTIWVPESQSLRAMGGDRFKESKAAILDWIAAQIGVEPSVLARQQEPV